MYVLKLIDNRLTKVNNIEIAGIINMVYVLLKGRKDFFLLF